MRRKNTKKIDAIIIALLVLICVAIGIAVNKNTGSDEGTAVQPETVQSQSGEKALSYTDYAGKKIGVQTATTFDQMI